MSDYTTELRYICESMAGDVSGTSPARKVDAVIAASRARIFDFDYPIFDESYREHLEKKILRHFYFKEIGLETYGQWQVQLCDKMNMIMPYYNQLYKSELLEIDPLLDYKEFSETVTDDNRTTNSKDSGEDKDIYGDTITDRFGKKVTDSGTDTFKFTPGVTDTTTRRPNLTHTKNGNEADSGADEQTIDSSHGETSWDVTSDTPQGGLNNIIGSGSAISVPPGTPVGGTQYASQIAEHTNKTADNSGKTTHANTHTYNAVTDTDTGDESTTVQHSGTDENKTFYGKAVTDSGSQSQEHRGDTRHSYGKIVDGTDKFNGKTTLNRYGFNAGQHQLLKQFRENMLNIDAMVCGELNELFIGLYDF